MARKSPSSPVAKAKISKVMREHKEGMLHSGSKKGPIVKSRQQAIAIALSEGRKAESGDYQDDAPPEKVQKASNLRSGHKVEEAHDAPLPEEESYQGITQSPADKRPFSQLEPGVPTTGRSLAGESLMKLAGPATKKRLATDRQGNVAKNLTKRKHGGTTKVAKGLLTSTMTPATGRQQNYQRKIAASVSSENYNCGTKTGNDPGSKLTVQHYVVGTHEAHQSRRVMTQPGAAERQRKLPLPSGPTTYREMKK